jgi:2-polyprenyl-3-methyl-5-hydroxy-6-metoxy-1,4-benzoquinol methylase
LYSNELQKSGNRVTGIDPAPEPGLPEAFEKYIRADLDDGLRPAIDQLGGKRFDRVLALDILEHLKNPDRLLRQCGDLLSPHGQLIVSVPNVANIRVRAALLFGQFNYDSRGILDRTHLRFFTRKTARRLLEENGFRILDQKLTVIPLEFVFGLPADNLLMRMLNRVLAVMTKLMPGLLGYQIVLVARPNR